MQLPFWPDPSSNGSEPSPSGADQLIRRLSAVMLGGATLLVVLSAIAPPSPGQSSLFSDIPLLSPSSPQDSSSSETGASSALTDRFSHPSTKLAPYFTPSASLSTTRNPELLRQFHALLDQYVHRQAHDDNFSIRVIDRRTDDVLERFALTELRAAYDDGASVDWATVDEQRRTAMDRLVDKYERRGVPLDDIIVRWGRANQVRAAHERDRGARAYERRLAEHLGLSLLATEIGTVETFNQDHLVSTAGAVSRYQMLPWILRRGGVTDYTLPTEAAPWVRVREERNPLLVLEPAFLLLRGYVNAVGHELPGLSAYHAGPGNIFKLYRRFYTSDRFTASSTVADAYAWAVTEGFETVREGSTFGGDSRGYVPAAYGALMARDDQAVEQTPSLRAVRVQVRPGTSVTLRQLLAPLDSTARPLDWGPAADTAQTTYDRFRALNPHIDLPSAPSGSVPETGNVRFVSAVDGKAVRFFLPLGAPDVLRATGISALDSTATFRYDDSAYAGPSPDQVTRWDQQYEALVDDIAHFGFTEDARARLLRLHDRFETLAEQRPTRYRRRQLRIISTHRRLWMSNPWQELADATARATGQMKIKGRPPDLSPTVPAVPDTLRPRP
ncbi:hypothetical protein [Salinibacter altiplanensis]|uniref:hypothetical protein n=1 Tax=Salinibacter altiplanensis TaxID=1803181 RepID=UPI000C9FB3FB|nr:hypothetical protein [Salinibacter altiplanensis]